jgi:hypothetical protein
MKIRLKKGLNIDTLSIYRKRVSIKTIKATLVEAYTKYWLKRVLA